MKGSNWFWSLLATVFVVVPLGFVVSPSSTALRADVDAEAKDAAVVEVAGPTVAAVTAPQAPVEITALAAPAEKVVPVVAEPQEVVVEEPAAPAAPTRVALCLAGAYA